MIDDTNKNSFLELHEEGKPFTKSSQPLSDACVFGGLDEANEILGLTVRQLWHCQ
jgi:hypothetical protein